jgi:hypothetical protein
VQGVGVVTFTHFHPSIIFASKLEAWGYTQIKVVGTGLTAIVFPIAVVGARVVVATVVVVVVAVMVDKSIDSCQQFEL